MTVKELAEQYRVQLGLRTWEDQAAWAEGLRQSLKREVTPETFEAYVGRQSGRTTKGLLHALAKTVLRSRDMLLVVEGQTEFRERALVENARMLVDKLGLDVTVRGSRSSCMAYYTDHDD